MLLKYLIHCRQLNAIGVRSKVIQPSSVEPHHYTVYAQGVDTEEARAAVTQLKARPEYSEFMVTLKEDDSHGALRPLFVQMEVLSHKTGKRSSSGLIFCDSEQHQYYMITTAHGLLSDWQQKRMLYPHTKLLVREELIDGKYTLTSKSHDGKTAELEITSSPVVCFIQVFGIKDDELPWPECCLQDCAVIPITAEHLKHLTHSESDTTQSSTIPLCVAEIMSDEGVDKITGKKGYINGKPGKIRRELMFFADDGVRQAGHHVAFELDNPEDQ